MEEDRNSAMPDTTHETHEPCDCHDHEHCDCHDPHHEHCHCHDHERPIRFILSPAYALRGWKKLPYALQYLFRENTEFFTEDKFRLLEACDGETDIYWDKLSEEQRKIYLNWEKGRFIRQAREGEKLYDFQKYVFYPARFKESVQWSITGKCNFRCKHCFMSAPHAAQGEPTWDELMHMLDAFERCGIRNLNLTGGEPMFRKDFWQLVDEIFRRHMFIPSLYSNGMLITEQFVAELERRHMYPAIQFSFDGVGHYDWMRGVPGAEKAVVEAMKRCVAHGFPVSASMVLFRENVGTIRETVNFLASLGVRALKIGNASPQGEWLNQKEHYLSQEETYEAFLEYIPHYFEDGMPLSISLEGFFNYDKEDSSLSAVSEKNVPEKHFGKAFMCGHVRRGLYVSPQGHVLPCMSMVGGPIEQQFPNMLETPLEEILDNDSLYMKITTFTIADFMEHNPECRECEYRSYCCGGCRAIAVRDHPTEYLSKDLVTCEYYKGGWMKRKNDLLKRLGLLKD